jgi:hypothetical protein
MTGESVTGASVTVGRITVELSHTPDYFPD